jgi:hypothetical protein
MGKMKEITSDDSSLTCAPMGFDSIHAKGNTEPGFCLVVSLFLDLSPIFAIFFLCPCVYDWMYVCLIYFFIFHGFDDFSDPKEDTTITLNGKQVLVPQVEHRASKHQQRILLCRHVCRADLNGMTGKSSADWSVVSIFAERVSRLQRVAKPHPLCPSFQMLKTRRWYELSPVRPPLSLLSLSPSVEGVKKSKQVALFG